MKTSAEIKRFLAKHSTGSGLRVRTIPSVRPWENKWVEAWFPLERSGQNEMRSTGGFAEDFRRRCLALVYGHDSQTGQQTSGGNIEGARVAMLGHQWETIINQSV